MKKLLLISYWIVAVSLLAAVMVSLGYSFFEALFIGVMFLPGALAVKYFYPKVSFKDKKTGIINSVFITIGIILGEILLIFFAQARISSFRDEMVPPFLWDAPPQMLTNPVFVSIMIAALAVGSYFFERWLDIKIPTRPEPITFLSERKAVTLEVEEILFIESNDAVTTVFATQERHFRNKTPISQWESILGEGFVRIHRSYLVNRSTVSEVTSDTVTVGGYELPVSRKYKDAALNIR